MEDVARVDGLGARAIRAVTAFVQMFKRWRATLESGHLAQLPGFIAQIITESGLEGMHLGSGDEEGLERVANLNELVSAAAEFEMPDEIDPAEVLTEEGPAPTMATLVEALRYFLESVALVSDQDAIDQSRGAVTLMTLHAAKGLEFDFVAMVGLEEGMLPHARSQEGEQELEEERRLFYVGMTRAKRTLHISLAASRSVRGQRSRTIPSSFIGELPEQHLELERLDGSGEFEDGYSIVYDAEFADEPQESGGGGFASRFPAGTVVRHPQFGIGTVKSISPRGTVSSARVAFHGIGTKTLILEYARLEIVHG